MVHAKQGMLLPLTHEDQHCCGHRLELAAVQVQVLCMQGFGSYKRVLQPQGAEAG